MSTPTTIRRALISVYDKTGIVEFATALQQELGLELISTGGTARLLRESGLHVALVEDITGFPEMMDGRVKTLHPRIHAGILADRDNPEHMQQLADQGIEPIDMVVVNLYPFDETVARPDCAFDEAIEMIDIGGPCLLRAAAKNHKHVLVVDDPERYPEILQLLRGEIEMRPGDPDPHRGCAGTAFANTCMYDAAVAEWLSEQLDPAGRLPTFRALFGRNWGRLRYGENPHQEAELLQMPEESFRPDLTAAQLIGEPEARMSFNNFHDASAALDLCMELGRGAPTPAEASAVCFIKHTNACGAALDADPIEAYRKAYLGDPNAAMGGILAVNVPVDAALADAVMDSYSRWGKAAGAGGFFVEVFLAPGFSAEAVEKIRTGRPWGARVRLLEVGRMDGPPTEAEWDMKRIAGGVLVQNLDVVGLNADDWRVVTKRTPTDDEWRNLRLAWLTCKHTRSNAITICNDGMLVGNGAGQMSRVLSCRIATWIAQENKHALDGAAAASDAFFPFRDGPDLLADAGVTALIQPGGSKRDEDTIAACDERGLAMVFTGTRHFKH